MEVLNHIGESDTHMAAIAGYGVRTQQSLKHAKFLSMLCDHAKGKKAQAMGIFGSEGNKLWAGC
jgi:hypothetical protein